jgi:hypothetical protein
VLTIYKYAWQPFAYVALLPILEEHINMTLKCYAELYEDVVSSQVCCIIRVYIEKCFSSAGAVAKK